MNIKKIIVTMAFAIGCLAFSRGTEVQAATQTWNSGNTTCTLTDDGVFTVSAKEGTDGRMADYSMIRSTGDLSRWYGNQPWLNTIPGRGSSTILKVVIEDGVTYIGKNAFCSEWRSSVNESEPGYPYQGLGKVTDINISSSVEEIGIAAFAGIGKNYTVVCKPIIIPSSVKILRSHCFYECKTSISYEGNGDFSKGLTVEDKALYARNSNDNVDYIKIANTKITTVKGAIGGYVTKLDFTDSVMSDNTVPVASESSKTTEVILPNNYDLNNKEFEFSGCASLRVIKNANWSNVTSIGKQYFFGCSSLDFSEIPVNQFKSIGVEAFKASALESYENSEITAIPKGAFSGCSKLVRVITPKATSVASDAFSGNIKLQDVSFGTLDSVGDKGFYKCSLLKSIPSLQSDATIGVSAFEGCTSIDSLDLGTISTVGNMAFKGCTSLKTVSIKFLSTVSESMFSGCTSLSDVLLESTTAINKSALEGNTSLKRVVCPNSELVSTSAFKDCSNLQEFVGSPKTVMATAFSGTGLTSFDFSKVSTLGNSAFYDSKLGIVKLPNSITSIESSTFANCSELSHLEILDGSNNVTIKTNAFGECSNLRDIVIANSVTSIDANAFKNTRSTNTNLYTDNIIVKNYDWAGSNRQVTVDSGDAAPTPTYTINITINVAFPQGTTDGIKLSYDMITWTDITDSEGNLSIKVPEETKEFYLKSGTTIVTVKLSGNGSTISDIIQEEDVSNGGESTDKTEPTDQTVDVSYSKKSTFKVRIPSKLIITNESGAVAYKVGVLGEISDNQRVAITPKDAIEGDEGISFYMMNAGGSKIPTTVTLDKQQFIATDINPETWTYGNGNVAMSEVKAGNWEGSFTLGVSLQDIK